MITPEVFNVVVDGFTHLGPLSYLATDDMDTRVGDAVEVPFGKRTLNGVIVGYGDTAKATRHITKVHGVRTFPAVLKSVEKVAAAQATLPHLLVPRLAPTHKKGTPPQKVGGFQAALHDELTNDHVGYDTSGHDALLIHPPLLPAEYLAVNEAARRVTLGQTLIICPTNESVTSTLNLITSGAVRLDSKSKAGEWEAFRDGLAPVAVGTRAAAWFAGRNLKTIIVVEENSEAHREIKAPRTHSRDIALTRSKTEDIQTVIISRTPSPAAAGMGVTPYTVSYKNKPNWPTVIIHDQSQDIVHSPDLPYTLHNEIKAKLNAGETVLFKVSGKSARRCAKCFQERNPSSPLERCKNCGETLTRIFGYDQRRVHDLLGDQVDVQTFYETTTKQYDNVVVPEVQSLIAKAELIPYQTASRVLLEAAAATKGGNSSLIAIVRTIKHPLVGLLLKDRDQWGVAVRSYRTAERLKLPPFGKLLTLRFKQKTAPELSGWPGIVHGPNETPAGWEYLVRFTETDTPLIRRKLQELKKTKRKMQYYIEG